MLRAAHSFFLASLSHEPITLFTVTFEEKILTLAKSQWKLLKPLALFFNQYFFDINVLPGNKSIRMSLNHLKSMREIEKSWLRKMESVETSNSVLVSIFKLCHSSGKEKCVKCVCSRELIIERCKH